MIYFPYRRFLVAGVACLAGMVVLGGCAARGSIQGMQLRAQQQTEAARQEAAANPVGELDSRATYLRMVAQMQQKGLYFASLAHIDALQQRWGVDPESNVLRADALRQTEQTDAAKALYLQLMSTPMRAQAAHGLGLIAGRAGDFGAATGYLMQANNAAPTDGGMLNDLGYALMQRGRLAEARVPLFKASELMADNPRVWSNIALYLMLDGQADQAQAVMDKNQLPAASRAQITELARTIQQRQRTQPVATGPAADTAPAAIAVATARPVLQPSIGTAALVGMPVALTPAVALTPTNSLSQ